MTDPENLALAAGFPPATREDWRKLVAAALKGAALKQLNSTTYDGLVIEHLPPRRADARPIANARADSAAWQVLARIDHPDPELANAMALRELANGATGIRLVFADAVGAYGFGFPASEEVLPRVLDGVDVGRVAVELDLSPRAEVAILAALAKGNGRAAALAAQLGVGGKGSNSVRLGLDPVSAIAVAGGAAWNWSDAAQHFARHLVVLSRAGFRSGLAAADGRVIHNAGGSEAQELAFALSSALAYMRALEAEGLALEDARGMIFFRLAADADQFLTMAKFRALRKLWARVEVACSLTPEPAFVSAETAWRMMAQRDAHLNIVRATIAVLAAALGGADAICVLPFSAACGLPDDFARRIARNSQLILLDEAQLARVTDPAAGSGAVEDLTDQLCRLAWRIFQEIEAAGGAAGGLESGLIQSKVGAVRAARAAAVARLWDALTGVSIFPDVQDGPSSLSGGAGKSDRSISSEDFAHVLRPPHRALQGPPPPRSSPAEVHNFAPLSPIRLAEPFETLRDASDRHLAATGTRPKIFLANLGAMADFGSRASFAKSFFATGGLEAESRQGDLAALRSEFEISGLSLACLCGSDEVYEREAETTAEALKAAGAKHVYVVGRAGPRENALRRAGVDSFIFAGCDALTTLREAHDILGVATGPTR